MEKSYTIDSRIYPDEVVERAIVDFKEVADITYANHEIILSWEEIWDIEHIFHEFINYITALMSD